jgi:6-phosphogluconolactonase
MSFLARRIRCDEKAASVRPISAVAVLVLGTFLTSCNTQSTHLAFVTTGANEINSYRIRNGNGVVTNVFTSPFLLGIPTFGIVVHPANTFALVANQQDGTISKLDIDAGSGALTEKGSRTPAGLAPGPIVLDSGGSFLFVADQALNQVLVFSVAADGALSQVSSAPVGSTPTGLTLASSGFLFVPVPNFSAVYEFKVSSGMLTPVCFGSSPVCSPLIVKDGVAASVGVDPAGKFLYVPNPSTNTVSGFTIDSNTGNLAPVPGVVFGTGTTPGAVAVDPSGKFAYVANSGTTTLSLYTIDSSGDLTAMTTPTATVGTNPSFIQFDPDGKFMYVGNTGSRSITQLLLNANGTLGSTGNTISVGSVPRALALTK